MDYKRLFLYIALALVILQLWSQWQLDYGPKETTNTQQQLNQSHQNGINNNSIVPIIPDHLKNKQNHVKANKVIKNIASNSQLIHIKTDLLNITLDTQGGNIIGSSLVKYPTKINQPNDPFVLLNINNDSYYVAQSGLTGKQGPDTPENGQISYTSSQSNYSLEPNEKTLTVDLHWQNSSGLKLVKSFTFTRDSYLVKVTYHVDNQSSQVWQGHLYNQLLRKESEGAHKGVFHHLTYLGGAISSPSERFEKIPFSDMQKQPLNRNIKNGWLAMVQHYFLSAWIPNPDKTFNYYSLANNGIYTLGMRGPEINVPAGKTITISSKFYTGPAIASRLENIAPGLSLTIDYGKYWWFISVIVFWLMLKIYNFLGNWGWAIVFVTLIIKLLFYKLSATSYRSMAKMRLLQPRIKSLKDRYGKDKQEFSKRLMELYKSEKVNPLGGCLPILVQIPVFLGLYWVLIESVELRQAPFIFWIHDLSARDPYFILPILMGVTMFLQQKMSPAPPDPTQAKIMMLMPIVFTALFATFPSGLVLYWLVNNLLSILQQWYITQKIEKELALKKNK